MRSALALMFALLLAWAPGALAQERHNFVAVNAEVVDAAGPYYFIAQGDSSNAFVRATPFAQAAGLDVRYDSGNRQLIFAAGVRQVIIDATSDISRGLQKRADVVRYDGGTLASPMAILVDGVAYVPITPIVAALGGDSTWHAASRVITIDLPNFSGGVQVQAPRVGLNEGVSRVALDLPIAHPFQVAVNGRSLAILLPGVSAPEFTRVLEGDPNLERVGYQVVGGTVALVVHTRHALDASGAGFKVGTLTRDTLDTVYVDFAPAARGDAATPMQDGAVATPAPAPAPTPALEATPRRYTVIIDAGHGGRDPGAVNSHVTEKEVVLRVALQVKARLEAAGVRVIMTRGDDTFLTLQERATFATTDRNIFVSIHANAADNRGAQGIETFIFGRPLNPDQLALAIKENGGGDVGAARTAEADRVAADSIGDVVRESQLNNSRALAELVQGRMVQATGATDRGVKQNLFYVLRNARIPAILVELGFLSHAEEGRRLAQAEYQTKLADAISDGILGFLTNAGSVAER